jgi:hypothetical protein
MTLAPGHPLKNFQLSSQTSKKNERLLLKDIQQLKL